MIGGGQYNSNDPNMQENPNVQHHDAVAMSCPTGRQGHVRQLVRLHTQAADDQYELLVGACPCRVPSHLSFPASGIFLICHTGPYTSRSHHRWSGTSSTNFQGDFGMNPVTTTSLTVASGLLGIQYTRLLVRIVS